MTRAPITGPQQAHQAVSVPESVPSDGMAANSVQWSPSVRIAALRNRRPRSRIGRCRVQRVCLRDVLLAVPADREAGAVADRRRRPVVAFIEARFDHVVWQAVGPKPAARVDHFPSPACVALEVPRRCRHRRPLRITNPRGRTSSRRKNRSTNTLWKMWLPSTKAASSTTPSVSSRGSAN